jgi:hypothetical protein
MSEPKQVFNITPELIEKLNTIYNYFGQRPNKLEKLFEECSEYRDRYILNRMSVKLEPKIVVEICDIISVVLQLLFNEEILQEGLIMVVDKAIKKIEEGYYEN